MNTDDLFVMRASKGIVIINPKNAEMLAVDKRDVREAIHTLKNDCENASCEQFRAPLTEENYIETTVAAAETIGILPTFKCNFQCEYCFERHFKKDEMSPEMLHYIKPFLKQWDKEMHCNSTLKRIGLMGGEIFRSNDRKLIEEIFQEFGNLEYEITTNGAELLLYKDLIQKYRPKVTVSLDGTERMQLSKRKTGIENVYQKIIEGVDFLVKEGINTTIGTVFSPDYSIEEYIEFMDILEELGWLKEDNINVNINVEMDEGIQGCSSKRQLMTIEHLRKLINADKRARYIGRGIIPGLTGMFYSLKDKLQNGKIDRIRCSANMSEGLVFAPDGYVYNCNLVKDKNNCVGQFYPQTVVYKDIVEKFRTRDTSTLEECKECKMALFCKGGCPASAISTHGTIDRGFCGIWKEAEILKEIDLVMDADHLFNEARKFIA